MRMGWEWERSHGNGGEWELKNHYLCSNRHTSNLGVCVCVNDWQWRRGSFCGLWLAICLRVTSSPVWRSASSTVPSTSDIPPNLSIRQNRTLLLSSFIYFIIHTRNKGPWPLTGCIQCTIIRQYKRVTLKGYWQCPHCNGRVSVRLSVYLCRRSTAAEVCSWFAAERPAGTAYPSTATGAGA